MSMYRPIPNHATRRVGIALCVALLTTAVLQLPSAAIEEPGQPASQTAALIPSGLVVVIDADALKDPSWRKAVSNPTMSGVALQIHWSDIEPKQGDPTGRSSMTCSVLQRHPRSGCSFSIFPGFFTPSWALDGVQTELFPIQYGPGKGTVMRLPMPWDKVYLRRWFAFLKLVSDRYGTSPAFRMIGAAGPTSVSVEFSLPNSPKDLKTWQSVSYTPTKYVEAWKKVFNVYADDFPHQFISLSVGSGLNIDDQGKIGGGEHTRTRQTLVSDAMSILGSRFALQLSDVHAGAGPHSPNSDTEDQFVIGYNGTIVTGFQMRTSAENGSAVMGAQGDPTLALRRSVDAALQPNAAGQRVNYLEFYEPDVAAEEMQPVLRYAASLIAQKAPGPPVPQTTPN